MSDRVIRLSKALTNESVKRLPWVILVFIVLLIFQFWRFNVQTAENTRIAKANSADTKSLVLKVTSLTEDNQRLVKQANDIANRNTEQQKCFFNIFVDAINKNTAPKRVDVENCTTVETASDRNALQPQPLSLQPSRSSRFEGSSGSSSSNNSTPSTPSQPNNPQSPQNPQLPQSPSVVDVKTPLSPVLCLNLLGQVKVC